MIESELKITLDARDLARLRRHPALAGLRLAPRRTETLGWAVMVIVCPRAGADAAAGFFSHRESERPAPGGRLVLDAPDDDGALADVAEAAGGAPLSPVFETRVKRVIERQAPVGEVLLVLDATTGQNGLTQARIFAEVVDVTGIVLTKLDGSAKGGIVVQVQRELGVPVKLVGLGEGADDLAPFDAEVFVDALLEEQAA